MEGDVPRLSSGTPSLAETHARMMPHQGPHGLLELLTHTRSGSPLAQREFLQGLYPMPWSRS
ncbi:MAG TPA: hypothetical protein VFZ09_00470 [Archangium sp.]|uniref:hypothetical protein n=1 Tax=Archangium sp. TaxID=1872627 RepID=UPI002E334F9C|nr:hypothetical protein [Archangium sp.]HEX5744679.1 hypothetical protein [Archangium sp.]